MPKVGEGYIELSVRFDQMNRQLQVGQSMTEKAVAGMSRSFSGLESAVCRVGGIAATVFGALAIGMGYVIALSSKQEESNRALAASMRMVGKHSEAGYKELRTYADHLQKVSRFSDIAIQRSMAFAINLTHQTGPALKAMTRAAMGLAAVLQIDLQASMNLMSRAFMGQFQLFTRYGIVLDETMSAQEKFAKILEIGEKGFALQREAADTLAGAVEQVKFAFGDTLEAIGKLLTGGEGLKELFYGIENALIGVQKALGGLSPAMAKVIKGFAWWTLALVGIVAIGCPIIKFSKILVGIGHFLGSTMILAVKGLITAMNPLVAISAAILVGLALRRAWQAKYRAELEKAYEIERDSLALAGKTVYEEQKRLQLLQEQAEYRRKHLVSEETLGKMREEREKKITRLVDNLIKVRLDSADKLRDLEIDILEKTGKKREAEEMKIRDAYQDRVKEVQAVYDMMMKLPKKLRESWITQLGPAQEEYLKRSKEIRDLELKSIEDRHKKEEEEAKRAREKDLTKFLDNLRKKMRALTRFTTLAVPASEAAMLAAGGISTAERARGLLPAGVPSSLVGEGFTGTMGEIKSLLEKIKSVLELKLSPTAKYGR